jgi:DNA primase
MNNKFADISAYLSNRFNAQLRGRNWRFPCPFCNDSKDHFGVDLEKGVTHCFKCDYSATIVKFISDAEDLTFAGVHKLLQKYVGVKPIAPRRKRSVGSRFNAKIGSRYIPLCDCETSYTRSLAFSYLKKRGLTEKDILLWGLGLSKEDRYLGRIIIPFFENDKVVYFVARRFIGGGPKYINPPEDEVLVGKSELLYNLDIASMYDEITICEGVFDVFAVGHSSVAMLGKSISDIQISKLITSGCKGVTIMLDADAKKEAYELASVLSNILPTKIALLQSGDPASCRASLGNVEKGDYDLPAHVSSVIRKFKG